MYQVLHYTSLKMFRCAFNTEFISTSHSFKKRKLRNRGRGRGWDEEGVGMGKQ